MKPRDLPNKVIQMFHNCLESFEGELDGREKAAKMISQN